MKDTRFLFPFKTKIIGLLLIALGMIFVYYYFFIGKPEFLNVKVFAIISFYMSKSYFTVIQTNIIDELGAIFIIIGLLLTFFSSEKREKNSEYMQERIKAIIYSIWVCSILIILSFLTVYGMAIFVVATTFFFVFLLLCNIFYHLFLFKNYIGKLKHRKLAQ